MNKTIKYLGFFDVANSHVKRNYSVASSNKMFYIAQALNKAGYDVEMISASEVKEKELKWYYAHQIVINQKLRLKIFSSFGCSSKLLKAFRLFWSLINIFLYLLFNTKKGDTIIVYHSIWYLYTIYFIKKIKHLKLVLEVEEIYQDANKLSMFYKRIENTMINIADAYILSTELLKDKVNGGKPSIVIYGTYGVEKQVTKKYNDNKIHCVYAGTFDPRKGGVKAAISVSDFLPSNYHIHICGFGSTETVNKVKSEIESRQRSNMASISYEGLLKGDDYIKFIQSCHIGLSTQEPEGVYNESSFPSKILSYMSNGLSVVSVGIRCVILSKIGTYITMYDNSSPESIAKAIMNTDFSVNTRDIVSKLDTEFIRDIKILLQ